MSARPAVLLRTVLAVVALAAALVMSTATPAAAHGRGSDATNMRSTVTEPPDVEGLTWQMYGGDELLEVTNDSDTELLIYGYGSLGDEEEYARVGPDGVFVNANARATYENEDRYADVDIPADVDVGGEPVWERVSDSNSFAWHDHRTHWMSPSLPPSVTDPRQETVINAAWEVPLRYDDEETQVVGELVWVPGPSPWSFLAFGFLVVLPALAGWRSRPDDDGRWSRLIRPAALMLAFAAVMNLTHLVDDLFYAPFDLATKSFAAVQTLLFLAIAAFGALRAWQAEDGAFTALAVGSVAVLVGQGLLYLPVLPASQNASLLPDAVSRSVVAISIAQALPLLATAVRGTRAALPPPEVDLEAADEATSAT